VGLDYLATGTRRRLLLQVHQYLLNDHWIFNAGNERPVCGGAPTFDVLLMPVVAGDGNAYFRPTVAVPRRSANGNYAA
jgi:hypothetical protein